MDANITIFGGGIYIVRSQFYVPTGIVMGSVAGSRPRTIPFFLGTTIMAFPAHDSSLQSHTLQMKFVVEASHVGTIDDASGTCAWFAA